MNYYEHHIGDYAAATSHLSLVEDAVYSRMLRRYYMQEAPLPSDWRQIARLVGARVDVDLEAVQAVLSEYFTLTDDGYRQKRADELIASFHERQGGKQAEREAEAERKRRYRERRADLFAQLRELGVVPSFDTATDELVRLLSHGTGRGQDADGTATQAPSTNHQSPSKAKAPVQRSAARFAEFWSAYPVKKGKAAAEKAWKARGLDAIADQIIAHVHLMRASDDDWQRGFAPHGSTYINGDRWQDEPKQARCMTPTPQPASKTLNAIQALEGMKHGLAQNRISDRIPEDALLELGSDSGD